MTKDTSSYTAIYEAGIALPGTLYLLQQLNERGPLRNRDLMNKDVYNNPPALSYRLKKAHKGGLIDRNVTNIPGEQPIITYSINEYGRKALKKAEELEAILQEAKSKVKK